MNIIIVPPKSSWLGFWIMFKYAVLFAGYFIYPHFIAFEISKYYSPESDPKKLAARLALESAENPHDMTQEVIIDVIMCIDICLNFITSF